MRVGGLRKFSCHPRTFLNAIALTTYSCFSIPGYRCCYCYTFNPARRQKPNAPKIEPIHKPRPPVMAQDPQVAEDSRLSDGQSALCNVIIAKKKKNKTKTKKQTNKKMQTHKAIIHSAAKDFGVLSIRGCFNIAGHRKIYDLAFS